MTETEPKFYIENLCTQEEFENMDFDERKKYIDRLYGNENIHEIIAKIIDIRDKAMFITAEYFFLFNEKRVIKFRICSDEIMSNIGSGGYFDRNIALGQIKNYCKSNNFKIGDKVVCQLMIETNNKQIDRKKYLTFSIESLRHFNYKEIGEIYSKYEMNYEAGKFYRVESDEDLDAIVCQDIDEKLSQILNKKKSEIEQLEDSIKQLKDLKDLTTDDYDKEISYQKQRLIEEYDKEITIQKQKLNEEYDKQKSEIQNNIAKKENEIAELNQEKIALEEKLKFLRAYDVDFSDEESDNENAQDANINDFDNFTDYLFDNNSNKKISPKKELANFDNFDEMIDYWQSHLNTVKYGFLKYNKRILASLYFGLQTDQLILLMGNPGTGKTSLVKALAKSFNFADAKIIPVQSNWTDKSDLLGYYNPLEKNYVSTPFLDALINFSRQAENNPEKLFIICLDEMNLSHIEYYFAEFLSILQDDNAEITLYSEQLQKDILYELQNSGFEIDGDKIVYEGTPLESLSLLERKYYFELRRLAQMLKNYPAKFKIPKNVKFFGTLNQDETTLDISPKVLDRSYVIRVEKYFGEVSFNDDTYEGDGLEDYFDVEIETGEETPLQYKPLESYYISHITMLSYSVRCTIKYTPLKEELLPKFDSINISCRVTEKILGNEKFSDWEEVLSKYKLKDFIVASCVLPKVRLSDESYEKYAAKIEKLCSGKLSKKIWEHINSPKDKQVDFWRR